MKKILTLVAVLSAAVATSAPAAPQGAWLDLENCGMCKNLHNDTELFEAMQWDTRLFENGLIEITMVPVAYEARFQKLMQDMEATGARMMAGEKMPVCGMCRSYGDLMAAGVKMEQMQSGEAHISVISSRDPQTIELIHKHGQTTIDEYAKWVTAEGGKEHPGHEHPGDH